MASRPYMQDALKVAGLGVCHITADKNTIRYLNGSTICRCINAASEEYVASASFV